MAVIGIMDSGSGGLSVLREILRVLPDEEYIYFSDNAFCPYGEKSAEFISGRCHEIVSDFKAKGADAVVIACNTATAAAIPALRAEYPDLPLVGMEPAVKPAALGSRSGVIGVLATKSTLKSTKYIDTRSKYTQGIKVVEHIGEGFVELVESLELSGPHAESVVRRSLQPILDEGADTIVLGCTHYPFLLPVFKQIAGKDIKFIDPAPAVARQLIRVLEKSGIECHAHPSRSYDVTLLSSGSDESLKKLFRAVAEELQ